MRIALDVMGGDLAPAATVEGAVAAARDFGIEVVLVGDREVIERELAAHKVAGLPVMIEHAAQVVTMDDSPLESVLSKPDSSVHKGLELVRQGAANAFLSAGNSGAVMAAAMVILGTLPGVDRPAIGSLIPATGGFTLLIDAGANTEVKPLNLLQFAVMGSVYCRRVRGVASPRVGILANGEEDSKGNELTRAAAGALGELTAAVNYIGYVEGRDINRGKADVVVTDGFTGNVALKAMEGASAFILGNLREIFITSLRGRLSYMLVRKRLRAMRARLDPSEYGGAPLLGTNGVTMIAHGSSSAHAIRSAIRAAANEALVGQVNAEIAQTLSRYQSVVPAKPSGKGFRAIFSRMRDRLHIHREAHPDKRSRGAPASEAGRAGEGPGTGPLRGARPDEHEAIPSLNGIEPSSGAGARESERTDRSEGRVDGPRGGEPDTSKD